MCKLRKRITARIAELQKSRAACKKAARGFLDDDDAISATIRLASYKTQTSVMHELQELLCEAEVLK